MKEYTIVEKFNKGDVIVEEGYQSNYAYVILSGEVKVRKKIGSKNVVIGTLKTGDVFGELGLIDKSPRYATITALTNVSVGMIDKETFSEQLNEIPTGIKAILEAIVARLKITTERLINIGVQLDAAKRNINTISLKLKDK